MRKFLLKTIGLCMAVFLCLSGFASCRFKQRPPQSVSSSSESSSSENNSSENSSSGNSSENSSSESPIECRHNWLQWEERVSASCTQEGERTRRCFLCGEEETEPTERLGHKISEEWTFDKKAHWHACERCGEAMDTASDHSFDAERRCGVCGAALSETQGLAYEGINGGYRVVGRGSATDKTICIPAFYNGLPVKEIGERAFEGDTGLTTLVLGECINSIGEYAFVTCEKLEKVIFDESLAAIGDHAFALCNISGAVDFPAAVKTVGIGAFSYCRALTRISFGQNVDSIGNIVVASCFALEKIEVSAENETYKAEGNCLIEKETEKLISGCKTSVIPQTVKTLAEGAFLGCRGIVSLSVPEGVTTIEYFAFQDCTALKSILLPKSLTNLSMPLFPACFNLSEIRVAEGGAYFSEANCVIERETKKLVAGCKTSVIPDGVESIGSQAFRAGMPKLVNIPRSVKRIEDFAFYDAAEKTDFVVPDTVEYIGGNAFAGFEAVIWCEAVSQPANWSKSWAENGQITVHWGNTWEYTDGKPVLKENA